MGRQLDKKIAELSVEFKQEVINFYLYPNSAKATRDFFKLSRPMLDQILAEGLILHHSKKIIAELDSKSKCTKFDDYQVRQIIELYLSGKSIRTIAKQYSVDDITIKKILIKNNISLRTHEEQVACGRNSAKQTCLETYGVDHHTKLEEIKKKRAKTNIALYGRANIGQFGTTEFEQAMLLKYGTTNITSVPEIRAKIAKTCQEKYGGIGFASDELREKSQDTCEERYGNRNYHNWDLVAKTNIEKYGAPYFAQTNQAAKSRTYLYIYDNEHFDSSWELALWIYAKDHKEEIEREPIRLEYFVNEIKHYYFPDFRYMGKLIEIKGDHFIKAGKLVNLYNTDTDMAEKLTAKQKCMLDNNIIIWKKRDLKFVFDYIIQTYGKQYLNQFKKNREGN